MDQIVSDVARNARKQKANPAAAIWASAGRANRASPVNSPDPHRARAPADLSFLTATKTREIYLYICKCKYFASSKLIKI